MGVDVLRTFILIVLTILGPLAFAFSVFDGLNLPWSNGSALHKHLFMVAGSRHLRYNYGENPGRDLQERYHTFDNPDYIADGTNTVYLVFILIGIIGHFFIPSIAEWVIQAGGVGNLGKGCQRRSSQCSHFCQWSVRGYSGNMAGGLSRVQEDYSGKAIRYGV